MPRRKWLYMDCEDCNHRWIAPFVIEYGFTVAEDEDGEGCPECGSSDILDGDEYIPGGQS